MIILSSSYFGNIQYFSKIASGETIYIDYDEQYRKQTYRNRAVILSGNGPLMLSVPVVHKGAIFNPIKELLISYDTEWQRQHWRSIISSYNRSPFFEFYADDIEQIFNKKEKFLIDLNTKTIEIIADALELDISNIVEDKIDGDVELDFRRSISPKKNDLILDPNYVEKGYTQVFSDKFGFSPNLSILDLLFNEGPNCIDFLQSSYRSTL